MAKCGSTCLNHANNSARNSARPSKPYAAAAFLPLLPRVDKGAAVQFGERPNAQSGASRFVPLLLLPLLVASVVAAVVLAVSIGINADRAEAASFGVGITIPPIKVNQTAPQQNVTPSINGTNISISLPVTYNGTGLLNITINLPSNWKKVVNIRVNESGVIKSVTIVGNEMTWESNQSATDVHMIFDAAPPALTKTVNFTNTTFFQKNLTIESENSFTNASVSIELDSNFSFYTLFWFNGTEFVDKTVEFNLRVVNGTATFDSFSTSTVLFSLEGVLSCAESWSCGAWSDSAQQCGTRTCTDANHCGTTVNKPSESSDCPSGGVAGAGGGGGGGGVVTAKSNVTPAAEAQAAAEEAPAAKHVLVVPVSDELIRVFIRPGEFKKASFRLTNTGQEALKLDITTESISDFVSLDTSYVELEPGESRVIGLLVFVNKETQPGTYSSKIMARGGGNELVVNVLILVAPLKSLFDALVNINPKTKSVLPGESIVADIAMFNLVGAGRFDVTVVYGIKDYEYALITSKQQTVAVETRASVTGILEVPRSAKPGAYYMFAVLMLNQTTVAVGSDTFEVLSPIQLGAKGLPETNAVFMAIMALIVLASLLSLVSVVEIVSHHLPHRHAVAAGAGAGVAGARKGFLGAGGIGPIRIWPITLRQKHPLPSLPVVAEKGKAAEAKQAELEKKKTAAEKEVAAEKEAATEAGKEEKPEPEKPEAPSVSREELDKKLRVLEQSFSAGIVSMKAYMEDRFKIENELKKLQNQ